MSKKWSFELYSWFFVIVFAALFILPIYYSVGHLYQYYIRNIASIIVFVTLTRYIFLLSFTPFSNAKWFKWLLIFVPIPLILLQIDSIFSFLRFLDEEGTASLFRSSIDMEDYKIGKFIKIQYLFFSIGALITLFAIPIRMIISFWRTINTIDKV
jgi:hypothetical protein